MQPQSNVPEWANVTPAGGDRHLPVYLLLDCSGSMAGAPIEAVRAGMEQCQREMEDDPFARDIVRIAVITFGSSADLATGGLVPIGSFKPLQLTADGLTRLDLAFKVLGESIDRDVVRAVRGGQKGDYKPVVFILTDGRPTDESGRVSDALWRPARDAVVNRPSGRIKPSTVAAVGCGPHVDEANLKEISTGTAFRMGASEAAFAALFQYLSQSITASVQPGGDPSDPFAGFQPAPAAAPDSAIVRIP